MTDNTKQLLRIRNLRMAANTANGPLEIIKGIDLDLQPGEVLGLVGESGAGKSTLGLASMGYSRDGCQFTDGVVEFKGRDILGISSKERRALRGCQIAYVAQSAAASFNPAYKLIDQYAEGPLFHGEGNREAAETDAVDLYKQMRLPNPEEIGFRYPHQISGGQLQRAMTAMAMSCRPDLIVFDEPTTALDVTTQIEVLTAIRNIVEEFNTAAIYITHDLAVVAQMADRIMVLKDGQLVEEADTQTMLSDPQESYTKTLWSVRSIEKRKKPLPDAAEKPLLSVKHVDACYGDTQVLHDISFDIYRGRTVAVVGESGSGKSTTAKVICGLLNADKGAIEFEGNQLPNCFKDRTKEDLRHIQFIYQMPDTALNPKQKIKDIIGRPVKFYLGLTGAALEKRVRALMEMIELDPEIFMNRYPDELSGGQKQRVGIARALAAEPDFIICDEVTSALDQLVAEGILKLLMRLQDELNLSYMFITHDLATVRAIADDVIVMQKGKVIEQGETEKMFKPPHHEYTELLLSSVPEMDPDWLSNLQKQREIEVT